MDFALNATPEAVCFTFKCLFAVVSLHVLLVLPRKRVNICTNAGNAIEYKLHLTRLPLKIPRSL